MSRKLTFFILVGFLIFMPFMNLLSADKTTTVFLCGDVMTGRGLDQVLPNAGDPQLHEPYMESAQGYVALAERENGPIQKPMEYSSIWGDALDELERIEPDVRIVNLETSITKSDEYWKRKSIHYRMHPENIPCLTAAKIDYCSLANNHILDWGYKGLKETLQTLRKSNIKSGGAGQDQREAEAPTVLEVEGKGRVIVLSYGSQTSGIPKSWATSENKAGISLLKDLSDKTIQHVKAKIDAIKQPGDIIIFSVHWGGNWGYEIPVEQKEFAHKLIDTAGVDVIHGHSSHHFKGIEVYKNKPIIYGCGDFLNDYEGISGYEEYRDDLALMYFVSMDPSTSKLVSFQMTPMQIKRFRLNRVTSADGQWIRHILNREGKKFETKVELNEDNTLTLLWDL